ncbi:F-box domain-containing protein [Brazilian cedratvirus IHUMI]|uniref:F-box domain-containing protein n=1 Tax=Brazilian cedratvirus IHUMI TaxID=2126980 RepID=A0A2R8FF37_9VIRU|nr:F-box domain-containing protein [Brazilian cedratvirus IHUMI]
MSLSPEVLFVILQEMEVENIRRISFVDRGFRDLCKSKVLWQRIFSKHNLVMLKKSCSLRSWLFNFQNSLVSKRLADKVMRENKSNSHVMEKVRLESILDVSVIHMPGVTDEDELDSLISLAQFNKNPLAHTDKSLMQGIDNPYKGNLVTAFYLQVKKEGDSYYFFVQERNIVDGTKKVYAKSKLEKEQVSLLLYKLAYHSLLHAPIRPSLRNVPYKLNYYI